MENIEKLIDAVNIPDNGSFTDRNNRYFTFERYPRCIRSKNAPIQVGIIAVFFILGGLSDSEILKYGLWSVAFLAGIWHTIENRYYYFYTKAMSQCSFSRYKQMMRQLDRIISSRLIYAAEMPLAYYVLKAKALMKNGEFSLADYLADIAAKEYKQTSETKIIRGIYRYTLGDYSTARQLFIEAGAYKTARDVRRLLSDICKQPEFPKEDAASEITNSKNEKEG